MARVFDADEPDDSLDLSDEIYCPKCGAQHWVRVLKFPRPGTWMSSVGKAQCMECRITFQIRLQFDQ